MQSSNSILRLLITVLFLFTASGSFSQTTVWEENFNATPCASLCLASSYSGSNGAWTVTASGAEGSTPNRWYVSCAENGNAVGACGSGCTGNGDNTLHICNDPGSPAASMFCPSGDCGALFDAGFLDGSVVTDKRAESPKINLTGKSNLTLTFQYLEGGSAQDNMTVEYFDGSAWTSLGDPAKTTNTCIGDHTGKWQTQSYTLPASANNNANVKIGFRWKNNDDAQGSDPSTAIDNVKITTQSSSGVNADFVADSVTICKGGCVRFTDKSTGNINVWSWTFPGGTPSSYIGKTPPKICYSSVGTYNVQLYVTDGDKQNTLLKTAYITVKECTQVAADFSADSVSICKGSCVQFTDHSTPPGKITQWAWTFTGGTPSSFIGKTPPKICYANTGDYNVSLYVSDGFTQNTLLKTKYINVKNCQVKPTAKFTVSEKEICQNQCIKFTDKSLDNPTSWSWSFQGGTPSSSTDKNPSNICFANPGTYKVVLTATNSFGSDTESVKIIVKDCPKPTALFNVSKKDLCLRECIDFFNASSNASDYLWTIDGPHIVSDSVTLAMMNPSQICFDSAGSYKITLTAFNSQGEDSYSLTVSVDTCPSLPSAFSPNDDGRNDIFRYTGSNVNKVDMKIYNRWGQLVFESKDKNIGWNGKFKNTGDPQEVGVYVYYIEATMTDGTTIKKKGNVTLLR